jgi:hypothetical protein
MTRLRRNVWLLVVAADAGILLWGAMAALTPEHLLGPGGAPILPAGYEGFSGSAWTDLAPAARGFMETLFRVYGAFNVAFGLLAIAIAATAFRHGERWAWWALLVSNTIAFGAAMTYDRTVHAIGPFELSEYLGLAVVYAALAVNARVIRPRGGDGRDKTVGHEVGHVAGR